MNNADVVYLGWQDRANFGDDLLYQTWKAALPHVEMMKAPLYRTEILREFKTVMRYRLGRARKRRIVLLGGGTSIGFASWASHVRLTQYLFGARRVFIAGAGCAEASDSYATALQGQDWGAWSRLRGIWLRGVRGPLSAFETGKAWQSTEAVGDPALLYSALVDIVPSEAVTPVVGVCVGSHDSTRYDLSVVAEAVLLIASTRNLSVRVYQLSNTDSGVSLALSQKLNGAPIEQYRGDVRETMESIASCALFVSERLHGAVASASLGVATVPLSYASKSDDFWMSLTGDRAQITPGSTALQIVEEMRIAVSDSRKQDIATSVALLQRRLHQCVADLIGSIDSGDRISGKWGGANAVR
ncbi:hypothetical protein C5B94_01415 [Clavibacter michiganensis]|uniref:polysaccharide pyruvyl transferase family protein n=1 Tax=Clavibacter michiganensis TaxID=28447 RepID=UPI000CE747BC|nr:polysaccharide pyruvyl transferase family protein [Clavibacter michiganensis]PPF57347.1 hypothetical protein C5B94_01415 [Clavibacter michiganensis]